MSHTHTVRTYEGQDAETEVVCDGGDNGAHPQHSERGIAARDDQVTRQIPEHVPAQQVTLKTVQSHSYASDFNCASKTRKQEPKPYWILEADTESDISDDTPRNISDRNILQLKMH